MIGLLGKGLNNSGWSLLEPKFIKKGIKYEVLSGHREITNKHSVILSIGYTKIIPQEYLNIPKFGIIIFHSSDLPKGRGWAPLFYTIVNKEKYLTQSMFYADSAADSGPIIAKVKYPINEFMVISDLRDIDDCLTGILLDKYIGDICTKKLNTKLQDSGKAVYFKKRKPLDSKISMQANLGQLYDLLRALPNNYPAFFEHKGVMAEVKMKINYKYEFDPRKVIIEDYSRN